MKFWEKVIAFRQILDRLRQRIVLYEDHGSRQMGVPEQVYVSAS